MTEIDLLVFGCAVFFIAAAGAYVFIRERFVYSESAHAQVDEREPGSAAIAEPKRVLES